MPSVIRSLNVVSGITSHIEAVRTLNVSNALVEDLLEGLGVLKLLLNLGDDRLGELTLLPLFDLTLVADPGVEDGLGLSRDGGLLLQLVGLSFKLGGFLYASQPEVHS